MTAKIPVKDFYNQFASTYDASFQSSQTNAQHLNEAAQIFNKYNSHSSGSILDLGCGTGLLKELLGENFQYTGIDLSENMLNYAKQRGYKIINQPLELILSQLPDSSYDFVFALGSLMFLTEINSAISNMKRIARKSVLFNLDCLSPEFIERANVNVYDHSDFFISNPRADYTTFGWTSPTTGISVQTRIIYLELS